MSTEIAKEALRKLNLGHARPADEAVSDTIDPERPENTALVTRTCSSFVDKLRLDAMQTDSLTDSDNKFNPKKEVCQKCKLLEGTSCHLQMCSTCSMPDIMPVSNFMPYFISVIEEPITADNKLSHDQERLLKCYMRHESMDLDVEPRKGYLILPKFD